MGRFPFLSEVGMVARVGPGVFPSGDPGHLLAGTRRPVSCPGSGGIQYLSIFPQQFQKFTLVSIDTT